MPEYIAALAEVNGEIMQIRRLTACLQDPELSRQLLALAIEIGHGAQEMDSVKELDAIAKTVTRSSHLILILGWWA
jgi:hypothetical protein